MPVYGAPSSAPLPDRLDGWDEIAHHLRKDKRTLQRWEREEGFPIHRHPGPRPRVWASRSEVDQWWHEREQAGAASPSDAGPPAIPKRPLPLYGVLAISALAALAGFVFLPIPSGSGKSIWVPDRIFARVTAERGSVRSFPAPLKIIKILLSQDSRDLYLLQDIKAVYIADPDKLLVTGKVPDSEDAISIALSPDDKKLYIGTQRRGLIVYDRTTRKSVRIERGIPGIISDIAFTPDGSRVYLATRRPGLFRYEVRTGELKQISGLICPSTLAVDADRNLLMVGCMCGGVGGSWVHDTVEFLDLASETTVGAAKGPPMVAGPLITVPHTDFTIIHGLDACNNPNYAKYDRSGCPFVPGAVSHVFRISDRSLFKTVGAPLEESMLSAAATPDGKRVIFPGQTSRVFDTVSFTEQETWKSEDALGVPEIDVVRQRLYFPVYRSEFIKVVDLPAKDLNPPALGLTHHWPGDGNPGDRSGARTLKSAEPIRYRPGLIGQCFEATSSLEATTLYGDLSPVTIHSGTVEAWIKLRTISAAILVTGGQGSRHHWRLEMTDEGQLLYRQGADAQPVIGQTVLSPGEWRHVAVVRRDRSIEVYLDGRLGLSAPFAAFQQSEKFGVQFYLRWGPYPGLLDEPAFYDRALSQEELRSMAAR